MIWRVGRESVVTLAGTCAILMQLAHPRVAAGVRDHSQFEVDLTGRLRRTLDLTMALVFGPRATAMQAAKLINARHRTVQGPGYSAMDPELLLWVKATLIYTALRAYPAFVGPLTEADRDRYYEDTKVIGVLLGIPWDAYPKHVRELDAYVNDMIERGVVNVGEDARRMGRILLRPKFPGIPRMAFLPLTIITAGLLPAPLREGYGLRWGMAERTIFAACRLGLPRLVAVAPKVIRYLPQARRAYRQLEAAGRGTSAAFRTG